MILEILGHAEMRSGLTIGKGQRGRPPTRAAIERGPLAEVVYRYRAQKGWSQGQLALYTGLSQSFLSQLERGQHETAEPRTLQKIANALGAPLKELLEAAGIADAPDFPVPETPPETAIAALQAQGIPDKSLAELIDIWEDLTPEDRETALAVSRSLLDRARAKRQSRQVQGNQSPASD